MPQLILVRHGNTFEAGETPRMVGGKTDMPLTAAGEAQGQSIATMIVERYRPLSAIIAGPLQRTMRFAEILSAATKDTHTIDERLCEICYGLWENKSSNEIRAEFGTDILDGWEKEGLWPEDMDWAPSKQKLGHNIQNFLAEQHKKLTLPNATNRVVITSNGILRFVYQAVTGAPPSPKAKVKTGHYCVLSPSPEGWVIEAWNVKP